MATSRRRTILFIAVPALLLLFPLSIYFMDSAAASDKVARNVSIAGIDVSRFTEAEATEAAEGYADELSGQQATVEVNGQSFPLDPMDVGFDVDTDGAVSEAMELRKDGITEWIRAFSEDVDVPVSASIDEDMLAAKIVEWEQAAIPNPAFEGSIDVVALGRYLGEAFVDAAFGKPADDAGRQEQQQGKGDQGQDQPALQKGLQAA